MNAAPDGPGEDRLEGQPNHKQQTADEMADLAHTKSLFGWIAAQIPVQPHKCSAFGLRGVAVRMHWSTAADQPKSYESCLTVVTLIEGCPRKRNSAKQALRSTIGRDGRSFPVGDGDALSLTRMATRKARASMASV